MKISGCIYCYGSGVSSKAYLWNGSRELSPATHRDCEAFLRESNLSICMCPSGDAVSSHLYLCTPVESLTLLQECRLSLLKALPSQEKLDLTLEKVGSGYFTGVTF